METSSTSVQATKIIFVHLLNDNSGSPSVLRNVIAASNQSSLEYQGILYLGSGSEGVLSSSNIEIRRFRYDRNEKNRLRTLLSYLFSQISLFWKIYFECSSGTQAIVYVNTTLPFGAAFAGYLRRCVVIYHVHEMQVAPRLLNVFLRKVAAICANVFIYVSDTHLDLAGVDRKRSHVVHNSVSKSISDASRALPNKDHHSGDFRVLMACYPRDYKGVPEFFDIADSLIEDSSIDFELLLNCSEDEAQEYFSEMKIPGNVRIVIGESDLTDRYRNCALVVNLSRAEDCVETFGLTLLEAMTFGKPVIAPPVGGPAELIRDGVEGYLVHGYKTQKIRKHILELKGDSELYSRVSKAAKARSLDFSGEVFNSKVVQILKGNI